MLLRNGGRPLLNMPAFCAPVECRGRTPLAIASLRGHAEVRRLIRPPVCCLHARFG